MLIRNPLFYLLIILQYNLCIAQIDISDKSTKPKIKAIPYDGSFMNFHSFSFSDKEKMAGVVGEKITLIDGFFDIKDENGQDIGYSSKDKFINQTFTVVEFIDDYSPKLKLKNESGIFIFKPSIVDHYLFNRYLEYVKAKFLNKVFVPLYTKSSITSIGGEKIDFYGNKEYLINEVKFSKLQSGFGIVFKINNSFECIMDDESHSSLEKELTKGWVEIEGTGILELKVKLLEKEVFKKFVAQNSSFIQDIRKERIRVGMTENQCLWAFGMASRGYLSNGYKIQIYGDNYNSTYLYFKNGKLKFIKK